MRWLIVLLISMLTLSDVLQIQMSLAPGMSVKNLLLYWIVFAMTARMVVNGSWRFELPALQVAFILWICYALFSYIAAGIIIKYPRYDLVQSGIALKGQLIDPALLVFATFYALRSNDDVKVVIKAFAIAITIADFVTIADVVGIVHLGYRIGERGAEAGRVFGVFGHANDTAGLICVVLPCIAAFSVTERRRWFWWGAGFVNLIVLIMTVSRGAYVAATIGAIVGTYLCRRYLPVATFMRAGILAIIAIVATMGVVMLVDPQMGGVLKERLLGQSVGISADEISSGRTEIWAAAFNMMLRSPITLLTGYGWDTYAIMPFRLVTHNEYLSLWFELGIPGVALFLFICGFAVLTARASLSAPSAGPYREQLIAYIFAMISLSIVLTFGNMLAPFPYIWIYTGVVMRAAMLARETADQRTSQDPMMKALKTAAAPMRYRRAPNYRLSDSRGQG